MPGDISQPGRFGLILASQIVRTRAWHHGSVTPCEAVPDGRIFRWGQAL